MKKIFSPMILSLAVCCLLMTSCAKEELTTNAAPTIELSAEQLATNYLQNSPTLVTFAVLNLNHETYDLQGIVIDNEGQVKRLTMEDATFLDFSEVALSNYFTTRMKLESEAVAELDVVELADKVKTSRNLSVNHKYTVSEESGNTSQIMLAFKPIYERSDDCGCGSDNQNQEDITYVSKIVLSANGAMSYEPTAEKEIALVNWLRDLDKHMIINLSCQL